MLKLRNVLQKIAEAPPGRERTATAKRLWTKGLRNFFVIQYHPEYKMNLPEGRPDFESREAAVSLESFFRTVDSYVFATNGPKIQKAFVRTLTMMEREDADITVLVKDRGYDVGMTLEQLQELDPEIWSKVSKLAPSRKIELKPVSAPTVNSSPAVNEEPAAEVALEDPAGKPKKKLKGFARIAHEKKMAKLAEQGRR